MKKNIELNLSILILLVCLVNFAGCMSMSKVSTGDSVNNQNQAAGLIDKNNIINLGANTVLKIGNIKFIKIVPAKVGGGSRRELFFDLSKKQHKDMVNNILHWLETGYIAGDAKDEYPLYGCSPTCLIMELKDGTTVQVTSAMGSIITKTSNGTEIKGKNIEKQVTIYVSNMKGPVREISPELKSFIESGWKQFFKYIQ